jgi:hypothetical protein
MAGILLYNRRFGRYANISAAEGLHAAADAERYRRHSRDGNTTECGM